MKKILLSLVAAATLSISSFGQAPEGFNYQAVVRDAGNIILNNQTVGLRMTIQQGSIGGTTVYAETFAPTTNAYGLVNLEIGNGTLVSGTFANIDWSAGPYFMETAVDVTGGTNYAVMGTSQLMSVPYALYAKTSGNGQGPAGPQGIQGPAGANGLDGANGIDGLNGATGAQGPAGLDGVQGPQGIPGVQGANGPQGPIGLTGATGAAGAAGTNGTNGTDGATGLTGLTGPAGADGTNGTNGTNGIDGATGLQGSAGPQGTQGLTGAQGPIGNDGAVGATGPQGPIGNDGSSAYELYAAANVDPDLSEAAWLASLTGADGIDGNDGAAGATGATGADGQGGVTTAGSGINVTGAGTIASPYVVSTTSACGLSIGDTYQGGIIFYLDATGCHGLIAAPSDQSTGIQWYNGSYSVTNAVRDGIGAGEFNTERIIAYQATGAYAAQICANYQGGNYGDWYLPSKYELNLMYLGIGQGNALGLGNIGGFASSPYWSSTESGTSSAWYFTFLNGVAYSFSAKLYAHYVRAVRAF